MAALRLDVFSYASQTGGGPGDGQGRGEGTERVALTYRDAARQEVDIQLSDIRLEVSDSCLEDADRGADRGLRDKSRQSGGRHCTATDNHC